MSTGIIIPPGDIKKLVEKTAEHVALNGSQFEKMILERQQHKSQFAFLQESNPYRAYYDHMVGQFSRKIIEEAQAAERAEQPEIKQQVKDQPVQEPKKQDPQAAFLERVFEQLQEPDPQKYTAQLPEKSTPTELAIIQHTAQYVARNGKNFLIALSERQKNNPQFEFLKSSSKSNPYFSSLVEAYTAILNLTTLDIDRLLTYASNPTAIMDKCRKAYDYYSAKQDQSKGRKQQKDEKKQQNIDWNDFELVDTIIFEQELNTDGKKLESKIGLQSFTNRNMQEKIISESKKKQIFQLCHNCGKKILASEMSKHFKACLRGGKQQTKK